MPDLVLPVRVYLEDTDAQGVVYNASYFRFMERARTEWLRAQRVDHDQLRAEHGIMLVLSGIDVRFRTPARLSDLLQVGARIAELRGARIVFDQWIRRTDAHGGLVCEGRAEVACVDAREGKPRRLPPIILQELSQ